MCSDGLDDHGQKAWCEGLSPTHYIPEASELVSVASRIRELCLAFERRETMNTETAENLARKGLGMMLSATKSGMAAISIGISKVRKGYANKHEISVLNELKAKGLHPGEHLFDAIRRLKHLYLAGYKHEVIAASQQAAKRLIDTEKSSVPLDAILVVGESLSDEALKYGDFQKGKLIQGMQDLLNKTRMGKENYDRDGLVHDIYYALLVCAEEYEGDLPLLGQVCREVIARLAETTVEAKDPNNEARRRAAKAVFTFAMTLKMAGLDADTNDKNP